MKRKKPIRTAALDCPVSVSIIDLQKRLALDKEKIRELVSGVLAREAGHLRGEVTVSFLGDEAIAHLNARYLNEPGPTDVLAFDISDCAGSLRADIIVSVDTAISAARRYRTSPAYEAALYAVHGLLHLIGYDDATPSGRSVMRRKERACMQQFYRTKEG